LEHEEQRVLRAQLELTQLKQELERRMNEKDEEMESQRKNHQRQLDALKQSLEEETRLKNEQVKQKKLVEGQVDELQGALDDQERVSCRGYSGMESKGKPGRSACLHVSWSLCAGL
jgi:hypothetical protein